MRLEHLNQHKICKVLFLGGMSYFLKYKDLQRKDASNVWASFLNQKYYVSENEELRGRVKHMEGMLANVITFIQNKFSGQDVNDIIQAARQVTDASSAPNHFNSPSPDINEDNENGEEWKLTWRLALEDGNLKMKVVDY